MKEDSKLNLLLISLACAFGVSLGVLVLLGLLQVPLSVRGPIFTVGVLLLSFFFYHLKDAKQTLIYSLIALGIVFVLFPMFMYLGIPKALPELEIRISAQQAFLISISTGIASFVLGFALMKYPFKNR